MRTPSSLESVRPIVISALFMATVAGVCPRSPAQTSWPAPVPNWQPVQSAEHPRLFFRKTDIPELKRRAETTEGKAIIARLKACLGGGEAMPTVYNPATEAYTNAPSTQFPEGTYTISHVAGFGLLYLLTGDLKYAGLAKQCFDTALAGQRDRDREARYSFTNLDGQLRAGPSLACYALGYDLCYNAWDPAYRQKIATAIQDHPRMAEMVNSPRLNPGSNHWGSHQGGAGIALLAIKGDPGTSDSLVNAWMAKVEINAKRNMAEGFGDGGYFWEHAGPSHMASNTAYVPYLQAMKVAAGKDYTYRKNAWWITMRWAHEIILSNGKPYYPCRHPSSYGTEDFLAQQGGMSHGGWFAQGFGAIPAEQKPALLWVYQNFVAAADNNRYDIVNYPHRAIFALINWPIGAAPANPSGIIPPARLDSIRGYAVFRNGWKNADDILVTALFGARDDGTEKVIIWGLGMRTVFGTCTKSRVTYFSSSSDGSGVVTTAAGTSLGIDFSKNSGSDALIVMTGPGASKEGDKTGANGASAVASTIVAGGTTFQIMSLQTGTPPTPRAEGSAVVAGGQTVTFSSGNIVFAKGTPATMPAPRPEGEVSIRQVRIHLRPGEVRFMFPAFRERGSLVLYGIQGGRVRTIPVLPGQSVLTWDGRNDSGVPVSPGWYTVSAGSIFSGAARMFVLTAR